MTRRVVFDTNAVVSALLFEHGQLAWLRGAWAGGQLVPVVCAETVGELLRVLAYPKFQLQRVEIDQLLGEFLPYAEIATLGDAPLPECDDPDDRVFLALALQCAADALVTGDGDLLARGRTFPVSVVTPAQLKKLVA